MYGCINVQALEVVLYIPKDSARFPHIVYGTSSVRQSLHCRHVARIIVVMNLAANQNCQPMWCESFSGAGKLYTKVVIMNHVCVVKLPLAPASNCTQPWLFDE